MPMDLSSSTCITKRSNCNFFSLAAICLACILLTLTPPSSAYALPITTKSSLVRGSTRAWRNGAFGPNTDGMRADSTSALSMASNDDKLIYDEKTNRFFEAESGDVSPAEEFFLVDKDTGKPILLTKEEKERIFLDSVQSYYFSGSCSLSDEQFDKLKEDLTWEGSNKITLNRNETLFLSAMQAYNKGAPIIPDKQFDELKITLREQQSTIAVGSKPVCYVDSGVCKVTWSKDQLRTNSLYVPATFILTTLYIGIFYEIPFIRMYLNPLFVLLVGAAPISVVAKAITETVFFKDPLVIKGPCPSCGTENKIFFGDVFGVEGPKESATSKCTACKSSLTIKRSTLRVSTLPP